MNRKTILQCAEEEQPSRVYKVDLTNRAITSIVPVKQFDKLRCLILSYNNISNIENINCYPDLRQLHLESNSLSKLGGVEGNKVLQVLNLRHNHIEKIQNIGHLIKLETLILDHNCISKIAGLEYLKDLKHLYVSHNRIESVENLPAFSKLQNLNLSHNKIKNIPTGLFSASKNLSFLDLSHNRIETTAFLQNLSSLESLNISHNKVKQLQVNIMPNLESIDASHNQLEALPVIGTAFPEVVSMNISYNMICSQLQVLTSLSEAEYLTEFDCRQNPMMSASFENGLQRIHNFDFLNGKTMTQAGAKYYEKINKIQQDLHDNSVLYGEDDEQDRKIKMSGFYDDDLESRMTGMKVNRPSSPGKKKKMYEKETFYDDIDRTYHEFMDNDRRIKVIRQHYLKICGDYNIKGSQHILTQLPPQTMESVTKQTSYEEKPKQEEKKELSHHFITSQNEIRKENQKNLNKWKELKQRQKSFNIREVIKKSRGKDSSMSRGINSSTGSNWGGNNGFKAEKMKSQLLRTQAVPRKTGDDLLRTMVRPKSVRKKD